MPPGNRGHNRHTITDRFGRVWISAGRNLYTHDDTISIPRGWVQTWGLPSRKLATNPNYARLCDICRSEWSQP